MTFLAMTPGQEGKFSWWLNEEVKCILPFINIFALNVAFCYPLKTLENLTDF